SLSFRKIVRISMDLSVFSLAFVNSTTTFEAASINLNLKVFFMLLSAVIILLSVAIQLALSDSSVRRNPSQQTSNKISQLIEIVRVGDVYILTNGDFSTRRDLIKIKGNNWHFLTSRTFANTPAAN